MDEVKGAHIDRVADAVNDRLVQIDPDPEGVADVRRAAADLRALDEGLKVRLSERQECFIVFHERHDGCPHNGSDDQYLVTSVDAYQTSAGTWAGLDQRVVERLRRIDPSKGDYGYAERLERNARERRVRAEKERLERLGDPGERLKHAIRKDVGYKGRIFLPRGVS